MSPYLSAYVGEIDWPRARVHTRTMRQGPPTRFPLRVLARVGSDETDGMVSLIDVRDDEGRVDLGSCSTAERLSLYEAVWAASRDRNDRWDRERYARACGL